MIIPSGHDPQSGGKPTLAPDQQNNNLARRAASALVLAPVAVAVAGLGGWIFVIACAIAAGLVVWEWTLLVARRADLRILIPGWAALVVAALLAGEGQPAAAIAAFVVGALVAGATVTVLPQVAPEATSPGWAAAGVIYAGIAFVGPAALRGDPEKGFAALLFLFATVWATDILAYLVGRSLGGPLLWPQLSPKKTWAGAIGGLCGGVVAGALIAYTTAGTKPLVAGVLALILSIAAQGGDLFESWVKRRFGAKDAGALIPGHGGMMDRIDGFLAAALLALVLGSLRLGIAAAARGLLVW
ncbi:MAG: phosphatidate cytidylyltransferase [Xanthobacteraceae bacterium]